MNPNPRDPEYDQPVESLDDARVQLMQMRVQRASLMAGIRHDTRTLRALLAALAVVLVVVGVRNYQGERDRINGDHSLIVKTRASRHAAALASCYESNARHTQAETLAGTDATLNAIVQALTPYRPSCIAYAQQRAPR